MFELNPFYHSLGYFCTQVVFTTAKSNDRIINNKYYTQIWFNNLVTFTDDLNKWTWPCLLLLFKPYRSTCRVKRSQICAQASLGYGHSLDVIKCLVVCTNSIYGFVMFSFISQKHVLGHNFWTKAHRIMILVSMTMFWVSRIQVALFISSYIWPCLISHIW